MEEGPEPQEWVERSVEHHHHAEGRPQDARDRQTTMLSAITAAVLAVFAAFGSLLAGHEANQAILNLTRANDQWAYYQSKSTKGHVYEVGKEIVKALGTGDGAKIQPALNRFDKQIEKYEKDKDRTYAEATHFEAMSEHQFEQHHYFALGIAAFQIGIVLASISILVRYRLVWYGSLLAGVFGMLFLARGLLLPIKAADKAESGKETAARLAPVNPERTLGLTERLPPRA